MCGLHPSKEDHSPSPAPANQPLKSQDRLAFSLHTSWAAQNKLSQNNVSSCLLQSPRSETRNSDAGRGLPGAPGAPRHTLLPQQRKHGQQPGLPEPQPRPSALGVPSGEGGRPPEGGLSNARGAHNGLRTAERDGGAAPPGGLTWLFWQWGICYLHGLAPCTTGVCHLSVLLWAQLQADVARAMTCQMLLASIGDV